MNVATNEISTQHFGDGFSLANVAHAYSCEIRAPVLMRAQNKPKWKRLSDTFQVEMPERSCTDRSAESQEEREGEMLPT